MADRQFTYKVDIDTASAKAAADTVRAMFAQSISGGSGQVSESKKAADAQIQDIKRVETAAVSLQGVLKTGFLAYGAALAVRQATEATVKFGQIGAQQLRTQETIGHLGDMVGVNAEEMAQAVKKATNSSISDMQTMQFSANILAQRFAGDVDDIAGDTATLAKASRRLAQIYTDENGELLTTQQVFSRLVKFSREGNKELVDQFGISNQLIADTLNIPIDGLRGAEGALSRWKGMVQIMNEELIRLGEPVDSTADRMEQAFARMTTAMDKLRQASAEPITIAIEGVSGVVDDFVRLNEISQTRPALQEEIRQIQKAGADGTDNAVILATVQAFEDLDIARARGEIGFMGYWEAVAKIIQKFHELNDVLYGILPGMQEMNIRIAALLNMTGGEGGLTREDFPGTSGGASAALQQQAAAKQHNIDWLAGNIAPAEMTEAEQDYRLAVGDAAERVRIWQARVDAAAGDTEALSKALIGLEGATNDLAGDIDAVLGKFNKLGDDIDKYQLSMRMGAADSDAERVAILQGIGSTDATPEGRANLLQIQSLQNSIAADAKREAKAAAAEWKRTAKEVERLFESAANKIMGIPGVTKVTPVTGQEMLDTRYGAYQNKPDEWLRRARDELTTFYRHTDVDEYGKVTERLIPRETKDYPDVSREQVEKLTGMAAGTPHDVMLPRLESMWESGSLFADKANLGLLNMDAIKSSYEEMKQGATGRKNEQEYIMGELGVSASDAALITGQQAPIVQMLTGGQSEEEISAQLGGTLSSIMDMVSGGMDTQAFAKNIGGGLSGAFDPGSENYVDVAGPTLSAWNAQFGTEAIVKGLKAVGKSAALNLFDGFTGGVAESSWGQAIITAIMNSLNARLKAAAAAS